MLRPILLAMLLGIHTLTAQDCDCTSSLAWLQTTFSENDAGFQFVVEQKGSQAYAAHHASLSARAVTAQTEEACLPLLEEWLAFFREGHIGIEWISQPENTGRSRAAGKRKIKAQFEDWPQHPVDLNAFKAKLSDMETPGFEGIWRSSVYLIAVQADGDQFIGSIIEADGVYWQPHQIKFTIDAQADTGVFYMRDHSPNYFAHPELLGNNHLEMGSIRLERVVPVLPKEAAMDRYARAMKASFPFLEYLDAETAYLRIPSFGNNYRPSIDSLIAAEKEQLLQRPNLIIDIRNNGGGSDVSYASLSPLLYSNPIHTVGVEFRSTRLNNQRMLAYSEDATYNFTESERAWAKKAYDSLSSHLGEFVNLNTYAHSVETFDSIYTYPAHVAILINEGNASTAEQFLLEARQSTKVKLFGRTTAGILDISNVSNVTDPCENFQLYYSLSRSMRIPGLAIDGRGIAPDYFMHSGISRYGWVQFVREMMAYW